MKKLSDIQGNSGKHLNELRNKINEQKECFTKEIETTSKNQTNFAAEEFHKCDEECTRKHWKYNRSDGREN